MTDNKKLTQKDIVTMMLADETISANPIYKEYLEGRLEALEKKSSSAKKPTATQLANEGIKADILEHLTDKGVTITVMQKSIPCCADLTNQKISALLKQLVDAGSVVKYSEGRTTYFKKA